MSDLTEAAKSIDEAVAHAWKTMSNVNDFMDTALDRLERIDKRLSVLERKLSSTNEECKFCSQRRVSSEGYYHKGQFVCPDCWDERLRVTE